MRKIICLMLLGIMFTGLVNAQKEKYEAAYIYQFTKYIEWCPAYKSGDFIIAVIGETPLYSELQNMAQTKKIVNQTIVVKKINSASELTDASVVVISPSKSDQLSGVLSKVAGKCSLVVSEKEGLAKSGAAISFMEQGGKIAFDLNKGFFSSHNLNVSSQLVSLAKTVY